MKTIEHIEKRIKVAVPEDWSADDKGNFLEQLVAELLLKARFRVINRVSLAGMEIDVLAEHIDSQEKAFVECKCLTKNLAADVFTKLIGNAVAYQVPLAYLFSTSPPGKDAKGILEQLNSRLPPKDKPKLSFQDPEKLVEWLIEAKDLKLPNLQPTNITFDRISSLTLLVTPDNMLWVVEESQQGMPFRAVVFPTSDTSHDYQIDLEQVNKLWSGLEIISGLENSPEYYDQISSSANTVDEEIVTSVTMADSFDDYRPCRPKDFVGRKELQIKFCEFLEMVEKDETATRISCFYGPSGFGKSSMLIKLLDHFKTSRKWKNKFYLYTIDVRAARGPLFVVKAVKTAFQQAIEDKFVDLPGHEISIENTELVLSSKSVLSVLNQLKATNKLIIIIFDQFEELFTKESLFSTFEMFRKLAFEADSIRANFVLGFCWRTGINFPDEHPAYYLWNDLRDKRRDFRIDRFTKTEAPFLITKLSECIEQKLNQRLRQRLLEEGQCYPWLLKKLCIHVYRQILSGTNQLELVTKQFNVQSLFEEDLEQLSDNEKICLRYIAENSPADVFDVTDKFGNIPDRLYTERRLVVKVGQNYTVYWDIFRDYLVKQAIPSVPWTYIPRQGKRILKCS